MELKQNIKKNFFFYIAFLWISLIFALGVWWLILIKKLDLAIVNSPNITLNTKSTLPNISNLTFWEGGTFFIILILLSILLIILYIKDIKKQQSIQLFFASMTHELKTPLASIHLQSEVLEEESLKIKNDRIHTLSTRLLKDSWHLENHIDKILQLARIYRKTTTHKDIFSLESIIENIKRHNLDCIDLTIENTSKINLQNIFINLDMFALNIIFRNLFENTIVHSNIGKLKHSVHLNISQQRKKILFEYIDDNKFNADINKVSNLSNLFVKYNSPKGTGIGLYLCKQLLNMMGAKLEINLSTNKNLLFLLVFNKSNKNQ